MSQLSPWETPQNSWGEVNVYGDYRDERPAREPRIHLEDAPGRNPFYIPLSPYDGIDRFTAYSGNYGENYAAAQKRQDHHTRFRLGGQQKRRLSLRNTGEESSYGDGPLYQPYPQGTNLLGYDTNGLPLELTVTAPRKHVAKYNDMGNPIYTTDRNLSMGYTTLPQIVEQMARKNALTEIKNRRAGKLTGTAKVMSDVAVGGIGSTLLPLVGQPIVQSTWPTIKDILPSLAKAEIGARTMDLATRTFTPYDSWSDGMGQLVQTVTGWNPNASTLGRMATDMTNPGYWNLYGASDRIINAVGSKVVYPAEEAVKTVVDNGTLYDPYTTFRGRFGNYGENILTNIYGTVARRLGDFRLLEELTGLKAGVAPLTEYEKTIRQFSAPIIQPNGEIAPLIYPNGREVDIFSTDNKKNEWDLLQRAKYNNVFYDPASMVESNWKKTKGLE